MPTNPTLSQKSKSDCSGNPKMNSGQALQVGREFIKELRGIIGSIFVLIDLGRLSIGKTHHTCPK